MKDLIPRPVIQGFELVPQPKGHRQYVKRGTFTQYPASGKSFDEIIKTAQDKFEIDEFVVGYSGGKDSGVVLKRMIDKGLTNKVLHLDTRTGVRSTQEFVINTCKKYDLKLYIRTPPPFEFIWVAMCLQYGFAGPFMHPMNLKYLKYKAIQKFLAEPEFKKKKVAIVTGVQKFESVPRMGRYNNPITQDGEMWQVMPIFWESKKNVYRYYVENNIKRAPAYDYTSGSLECNCSSFANRDDLEAIKKLDEMLVRFIKWVEYGIENFGSERAKKYKKWGGIGMKYDEAQQVLGEVMEDMSPDEWETIEAYICGEECGAGTFKGTLDY